MDTNKLTGDIKLRGADALNYLASNPTTKVTINSNTGGINIDALRSQALDKLKKQQEQATYDQKVKERGILGTGWLGDIIYNIGKSATALPRANAIAFGELGNKLTPTVAKLLGANKQQIKQAMAGSQQTQDFLKSKLLDSEERQRLANEGGATFLGQSALNTGSFFLPVGGAGISLGKAVLGGAGMGAAQSLANQDLSKGVDLGNLATSAALGAGTAGAFNVVGKGLSKLATPKAQAVEGAVKPANYFQKSNFNVKVGSTPLGLQSADELATEATNLLGSRNLTTTARNVGKAYQQASNELGKVLEKSTTKVPVNNALGALDEVIQREGINLLDAGNKKAYDWILNKVTQLGDNAPAQAVAKLKNELDDTLGLAFRKLEPGYQGAGLTPVETMRLAFRGSIDDVLKNAVPESEKLYRELSIYNQISGNANKAAQQGFSSPLLARGINIPTGGIKQNIFGQLGKLQAQGLPSIGGSGVVGVLNNAMTPGWVKATTAGVSNPNNAPFVLTGNVLNPNDVSNLVNQYTQPVQQTQQTQEFDRQSALKQAFEMTRTPSKPYGDLSQAIALVNFLHPEAKTSGTANADREQLQNTVSELARLYGIGTENSLSTGGSQGGIGQSISGAGQDIKKAFDPAFNDKVRNYEQMRSLAVGILNKMRGAGTLNSGEYEVLLKDMPTQYSSEQQAQSWFQNALRMLSKGGVSNQIDLSNLQM